MNFVIALLVMIFSMASIYAQYPDKVGMPGCDAVSGEQLGLQWGISCTFTPGYISLADTNAGIVQMKDTIHVIGKADNRTLSLGDGGMATMIFAQPIADGPGPDFAVFENSFEDYFLEFAFVEVSSDGIQFTRFPAVSLTPTEKQLGPFDRIPDVRALHNLAGKYRGGYGTPFDLSELKDSSGVNIQSITHVRVIDVVGSTDARFARIDSRGNIINDPWPTPFSTCGFDMDAIAVINEQIMIAENIEIYPNPLQDGNGKVKKGLQEFDVFTMQGEYVRNVNDGIISSNGLSPGMYVMRGMLNGTVYTGTFMIVR